MADKSSNSPMQAPLHQWAKGWGRPFAPQYLFGEMKEDPRHATIVSRRIPIGTNGISGKFYGKSSRVAILSNQLTTPVPGEMPSLQWSNSAYATNFVLPVTGLIAASLLGKRVFGNLWK